MRAIILAAGKGTRCQPLTNDIPKVLMPINGKPFLSYLLEHLGTTGFCDVAIVVGWLGEHIRNYLDANKINVTLIEQKGQLGTGHALKQAEEFASGEDFLAVNGDCLCSVDDLKIIANFADNCIAGFKVANAFKYGVLLHEDYKLKEILEKPREPPSNLINAGIYKFTSEIFQALGQIERSPRGEYELTDAINILAKNRRVYVHALKDYWLELGKLEDIQLIESFLKKLSHP